MLKIFDYYSDTTHSISVKYVNNLPKNYTPKIKINIHKSKKNMIRKKNVFSSSYLKKIYKKFKYKNNKNLKTRRNRDKINRMHNNKTKKRHHHYQLKNKYTSKNH